MKEEDEVDQLLQAAQDDLLLKLSVDSHISHHSSDYLDSDLLRRFNALKSRPSASSSVPPSSASLKSTPPDSNPASEDDLLARFAALKAKTSSTPTPNPITSEFTSNDSEEDEVDKVIRWAIDAARLDPSPSSDDDKEDEEEEEEEEGQESISTEKPKRK